MPHYNDKERRRFSRVALETQISFSITDTDSDISYSGTTQNISAGGIYLTTDHAPKLGNHIKIVLNENVGTHLITEGTVVRCKFDKKDPDLFHVSVEFSEIQEYLVQSITNNAVILLNKYG